VLMAVRWRSDVNSVYVRSIDEAWSGSSYHFGTSCRRAKVPGLFTIPSHDCNEFDPLHLVHRRALFTSHTSPAPIIPQYISVLHSGS